MHVQLLDIVHVSFNVYHRGQFHHVNQKYNSTFKQKKSGATSLIVAKNNLYKIKMKNNITQFYYEK